MTHLGEHEAEAFVCGRLEPQERRRVVHHLLSGCWSCRERMAPFLDVLFHSEELTSDSGGRDSDAYDAALDRAVASARRWLLRSRDERKRPERVPAAAQAPTWSHGNSASPDVATLHGLLRVSALLQLSFEERYRDPARMLLLAFAARLAAERLDPSEHGEGETADLQARTWAELANAHRVNEQFDQAEAALARSQALLEHGSGDLLVLARVADVQASLRTEQRRLGEALDLLEIVHNLYRQAGDLHLAGRALVSRGTASLYSGDAREAVRLLRQGMSLLDPDRDPGLLSSAGLNIIDALTECDEFNEAGQLLLKSGLRPAFAEDPLNLLKLRWVEGKVLAGLGKLRRSERVFAEVRAELFRRDREYDAALVGLELAAVWLEQGKAREVQTLAEETFETLQHLGVHQEAVKAASFLRETCRSEKTTLGILRNVRDFLMRLQWQPQLRFAP